MTAGSAREGGPGPAAGGGAGAADGADRSLRVTVLRPAAEEAGAFLMEALGPFEEELPEGGRPGAQPEGGPGGETRTTLVFYPTADGPTTRDELLALLPESFAVPGALEVETASVSRDWVDGWRDHFRPIVIGRVRIRPPWEAPLAAPMGDTPAADQPAPSAGTDSAAALPAGAAAELIDVVINPGLGFGTGLHPTTRGTLLLLQEGAGEFETPAGRGSLVDVGTGSGILAVAAAKLGWYPVVALDNDPVALVSTRENVAENGVAARVEIHEADTDSAEEAWFRDATVLANMTMEPVSWLLRRLATLQARPKRLVVSGILAGSQEERIVLAAGEARFLPGRRVYEGEWVSFELLPDRTGT